MNRAILLLTTIAAVLLLGPGTAMAFVPDPTDGTSGGSGGDVPFFSVLGVPVAAYVGHRMMHGKKKSNDRGPQP